MHVDLWTVALQAANFLILAWLLQRFLYRPVLSVLARRQAAADALIAGAKAETQKAADLRKGLEDRQAALAADRQSILAQARSEAEAERATLLAAAKADAEAARRGAQDALDQERREAARTLGRQAGRLAGAMVERLLRQTPPATVQAALFERICDDVRALPAETKASIAERVAAAAQPVEVVAAAPLAPDDASRAPALLGQALGAPVSLAFRTDPALIAGLEIRFPFTILRRNWAEDLRRIQAELDDDDHRSGPA